jgi:post-segregation antitoxin (ccd killing protein)
VYIARVRNPPRGVKAAKQTVSLTINSDIYVLAKQLGINVSQVAEEALSQQIARRKAEQLQVEIRQDLEAASSYMAKHGSFAEMVRQHYRDRGEDGEDGEDGEA